MLILFTVLYVVVWIIAAVLFYGITDCDENEAILLGLFWILSLPLWGLSVLVPWISDKIF